MAKKVTNIQVKDTLIRTMQQNGIDYVCITDIARQKKCRGTKGCCKELDALEEYHRVYGTLGET